MRLRHPPHCGQSTPSTRSSSYVTITDDSLESLRFVRDGDNDDNDSGSALSPDNRFLFGDVRTLDLGGLSALTTLVFGDDSFTSLQQFILEGESSSSLGKRNWGKQTVCSSVGAITTSLAIPPGVSGADLPELTSVRWGDRCCSSGHDAQAIVGEIPIDNLKRHAFNRTSSWECRQALATTHQALRSQRAGPSPGFAASVAATPFSCGVSEHQVITINDGDRTTLHFG